MSKGARDASAWTTIGTVTCLKGSVSNEIQYEGGQNSNLYTTYTRGNIGSASTLPPCPHPPLPCVAKYPPRQGEDLAAFLGRHRYLVAGKRVLDLGAGTGVVGLAAAQCGAKDVVLTDRHALEHLVRSNVERNSGTFSGPGCPRVTFMPFSW